jgi:PIN domain nuclease of toxin-antitoxin system
VADPAAAVADTHAILFHAAGGRGLGSKAAAVFERCERQQAIIYVPAIVMWEVSLLARVSRVNLRRTVRGFFDDLFSNPSYQPFDMTAEQIFIADEPTQGIDVGAKRAIYELIAALADQGMAVLLISSELEEVLGLAHRVIVMRRGKIVGEFEGDEMTEEAIMRAAFATV